MYLSSFYQDIQHWIDSGFEEHSFFTSHHGLCDNLERWLIRTNHTHIDYWGDARVELRDSFSSAGLDSYYPFNKGDRLRYREEMVHGILYENLERLEWIKRCASST